MTGYRRLSKRRLKEIASLLRRKGRDKRRESIAEGARLVHAALEAGVASEIVMVEGLAETAESAVLLSKARGRIFVTSKPEFARLSDVEESQGILAVFSIQRGGLESLRDTARIVVMDGVQDPGNVGSIVRTSAWYGVDAVLAGPGCADFFNPKTVRASMGGLWALKVVFESDLGEAVASLADAGYHVFGAETTGVAVHDWRPEPKSVLVMGSEARGISEELKSLVRGSVAIPGPTGGPVESLNVGVALGVLLERWRTAADADRGRE